MYLGTIQVHTLCRWVRPGSERLVFLGVVSSAPAWLPVTTLNLSNPGLQDFCSHVGFLLES